MKKWLVWLLALFLLPAAGLALDVVGLETESVSRNWKDNLFFSRMEELTGVRVTGRGIRDTQEYRSFLERLLSGEERCDALFKASLSREDEQRLYAGGVIADMAPYIDKCMPHLQALLEAHPQWREQISIDGRILSLPLLNEREHQVAVWINQAWLNELGLPMPGNVEELTRALRAMKGRDLNGNGKSDEIPCDLVGTYEMRWLLPYFGIVADDYQMAREGDTLAFAPALPQYRAFVETLAGWAREGLLPVSALRSLHTDRITLSTGEQKTEEAVSGMLVSIAPYTAVPPEKVTDYRVLLMSAEGKTRWRDLLGQVWNGCFALCTSCAEPEKMLSWVDALYAQEGARLAYVGVEGTDYRWKEDRWAFLLDSGRDIESIRREVIIYTGTATPGLYPGELIEAVDSPEDRWAYEETKKVREVAEQVSRPYRLSSAGQQEAQTLAAALTAAVDRGIGRFVSGEAPMDDEHWTRFQEELEQMGASRLTELLREAEKES